MLGLKRGTVALYPHEKAWEEEAAKTIETLKNILGDTAVELQHVGSTSIKSIQAKPIIDIAVGVRSLDEVMNFEEELLQYGFYHRETDLENQLLFACGSYYDGSGELQTHFIHVVIYESREWKDYINFRDHMNANAEDAKQYEALKLRLAAQAPIDIGREKYLKGKHGFITGILEKISTD